MYREAKIAMVFPQKWKLFLSNKKSNNRKITQYLAAERRAPQFILYR